MEELPDQSGGLPFPTNEAEADSVSESLFDLNDAPDSASAQKKTEKSEHLAEPAPAAHPAGYSNTAELGRVLYTDYLLPFELASIVLLVAIVAAIALTLRDRKDSKSMDPAKQVLVKKADRIRIVKMSAEVEPVAVPDGAEEAK